MEKLQSNGMGRRKFIGAAAAALFAGVVITVTGCDEDDPAGPVNGDRAGTVDSANSHTHSVKITKAQIDASGDVTLTFSTTSGHSHDLVVSAADVAKLKAGGQVHALPSTTTSGHLHTVHFL